jgi:serine protease
MSLGGGISSTLDQAVANAIADGITFGIAAGNSNANACTTSPARVATALTVGSTTSTDARSSFSNFGSCLDIFAPGSSITSSWYTSSTATNTISGTSMATPHVVGAAALYLQTHPAALPAEVASALTSNATPGKVGNEGTGSPDLLLYTGSEAAPPPPPPPVDASPVARYTWSCTGGAGRRCSFNGGSSSDDNGITSYAWSFGDGSTAMGVTATRRFPSTGTFNVSLTVKDAANQSSVRTCAVRTGTSGTCAP